jgi:hypothetical protein
VTHHVLTPDGAGWAWTTLALLGAFHGLNPAMGWLFAVGLGLQERRTGAVLRAIPPIAVGHAAAVALVVIVLGVAGRTIPAHALRLGAGFLLLAFAAVVVLRRFKHPVRVGMRVGWRQLTVWSWIMASAHGAGLMIIPVLLALAASSAPGSGAALATGSLALLVHTVALLVVMTAVALAVYRVLGVQLLRRAWINLDFVWVAALVVAGVMTLGV